VLIAPQWPMQWLAGLRHYAEISNHPPNWALGLFAIPLLLLGNPLGASTVLPYLFFSLPVLSPYPAAALPLGVANDRRAVWLVPLSYLWWLLIQYVDQATATAIALIVPIVLFTAFRRMRRCATGNESRAPA